MRFLHPLQIFVSSFQQHKEKKMVEKNMNLRRAIFVYEAARLENDLPKSERNKDEIFLRMCAVAEAM